MDIQIYNTLTRRKETFQPIEPGKVRMYNCGPTVYDQAHIGNMRTYIFADLIRRGFEVLGYEVRQVMNITDVGHLTSDADEGEDRMLVGVRRTGRDPWEIAEHFTQLFFEDTAALNILRPHVVCKATEHIPEMIDLVQRLESRGYTYEIGDGIYFDVSRFPGYGQLSGQTLDEMRAGARVEVNPEKRHPADFALWRKATPAHIMQWDSPWGCGFPGWHIECSAMSMKYLGETLDIHTGGEDHIATHHPNEIAQSEASTSKPFVNVWMHGRFLRWSEDDRRMSKSSGEFLVVGDLGARGFDPLAFRYHCLTASYRVPLTFSWAGMESAAEGLRSLRENVRRLAEETREVTPHPNPPPNGGRGNAPTGRFRAAIADDFNVPEALAVTWETIRVANRTTDGAEKRVLLEAVLDFDRVLGLGLVDAVDAEELLPADVAALIQQREAARAARDWTTADALRQAIRQHAYEIEDTPSGTRWRRIAQGGTNGPTT
ncbi:MAG: cysteine--tRNA ligase [Anaerolineae bacterium]|nr:cysteine--tRNA ligase [Anaerolineae bacterium]